MSAKEAEEIASGILNQKYLTNVELALNEVKNADSLREAAQKALESNDVLEFKSRVGITLTPEEREDYTSNIKTFVDSKIRRTAEQDVCRTYSCSDLHWWNKRR